MSDTRRGEPVDLYVKIDITTGEQLSRPEQKDQRSEDGSEAWIPYVQDQAPIATATQIVIQHSEPLPWPYDNQATEWRIHYTVDEKSAGEMDAEKDDELRSILGESGSIENMVMLDRYNRILALEGKPAQSSQEMFDYYRAKM